MRGITEALSKAASQGILHKKTASRKISRLAKAAHKSLRPQTSGKTQTVTPAQ
jgi:small subunit ribosomal protein S20